MKAHSALTLVSLALSSALSCAPSAAIPDVAAQARSAEAHGPSAVDWVAGQLGRYRTRLAPFEERRTARALVAASRRYEIDLRLILALIRTESGFDGFAVSPAGALGLTQVMPATGREVAGRLGIAWRGPRTLFDPVANVRIGTAYLAGLRDRYHGRWDLALAAYNWGPARIDARLDAGIEPPRRYARRVLAARLPRAGAL